MKKIVVIGAGLGGLSASAYLAAAGYDVTVYEASSTYGGKAGSIASEGFRFDTGPSLLTMPFVLEHLFTAAGRNISDYIKIKPLDVLCKYFYPDGTEITAYNDLHRFIDEISEKTGEPRRNFEKYFAYSKKIYDLTHELFLFKSFREAGTFFNAKSLKTLLNIFRIDPFRTMHKANAAFFGNKKVVQMFDRYATYNGSDPYKAPATLNIIQHVEYALGGYTAEGGIRGIADGLYKLCRELGVKFEFGKRTEKILLESRQVKGIIADGKPVKSEIVVTNADVFSSYNKLLDGVHTRGRKRYSQLEPSSSALVFYWGVKGNNEKLEGHNILFTKDYSAEFNSLFEKREIYADPTVYIYISSKFNKGDAPEGHENWFVMINAPHTGGSTFVPDLYRIRENIIGKIEETTGIKIGENILTEQVLTPSDIENKTGSTFGSLYGISSNDRYAAFLRQDNKCREIEGLYFCGGSAHPGGGIPLVILSGKIASDLIKKYEAA